MYLGYQVLFSPSIAIQQLRISPSWLAPVIVLSGAYTAVYIWYFLILDYEWFIDAQIANAPNLSEEQYSSIASVLREISPLGMALFSSFAGALFLLFRTIFFGCYLSIFFYEHEHPNLKNWISMSAWSLVPEIFSVVAIGVTLLFRSSDQLSMDVIQGLNLSMFIRDLPFGTLIGLDAIWSVFLLAYGASVWLSKSIWETLSVVCIPYLVVTVLYVLFTF